MIDENENLVTNPTEIANLLQDHFKSVFSSPSQDLKPTLNFIKPTVTKPLPKFTITDRDIILAINEMKTNSSSPHSDIPASIFKRFKSTLCKPLKLFWKKSFLLGVVPQLYKNQQITPIHKKGKKTNSSNYRPISLTSHVIKIFERVLRKKLVSYLESNNIINPNQHGFRNNRSCLTQLLSHINNIFFHLTNNTEADSLYIDYAKAFDKVDHSILLAKLKLYGITDEYLIWLRSFLVGRQQVVFLNQSYSYKTQVLSGVPQGSVIGPLLFILYINDLNNFITHSKLLTFADDTKVITPIHSFNDTMLLQNDLNTIINWSKENNMVLNNDKFELVCHKSKNNINVTLLSELPFNQFFNQYEVSKNQYVSPSYSVRDLGITVSSDLDWDLHITKMCQNARKISYWILNVFFIQEIKKFCYYCLIHWYEVDWNTAVQYGTPLKSNILI